MEFSAALICERIRTANGRQVHVNSGGARAWAWNRFGNRRSGARVEPDQGLRVAHMAPAQPLCGVSADALACATQQIEQAPSWALMIAGLARVARGSAARTDRGRAQRIGGRDTGRPAGRDRRKNLHRQRYQNDRKKFPSRRRIGELHPFERCQLIMQESGLSRKGSPQFVGASKLAACNWRNVDIRGVICPASCVTIGLRRMPGRTTLAKVNRGTRMQPARRNSDHFENCSKFEQSLPKMMTRRKRWSTTAASGQPIG